MQEYDPGDEILGQWTKGDIADRVRAAGVAWLRYRDYVFWTLRSKFKDKLSFEDCQELADNAFAILTQKLQVENVGWRGGDSMRSYLFRIAMNDARDLVKKYKRRAGFEVEIASIEEDRRCVGTAYEWIIDLEEKVLLQTRFDALVEELVERVRGMKPKERAVGILMVNCFQNTGNWPSGDRLLEHLSESESGLKLSTVIDRRKEVLNKFKTIILKYKGEYD